MDSVTFIPKEERPAAQIGRPASKWAKWFRAMKEDGTTLVLKPSDNREAHVMRSSARKSATQLGLSIRTSVQTVDDSLLLYVWLI